MRRAIVPAVIGAAVLLGGGIAATAAFARRYGVVRVIEEELEAAPTVEIDVLGALRVVADDVDKVLVHARVFGSEEAVAEYVLGVERDGETLHLRLPGTPRGRGWAGVGVRVVVPRGTRVHVRAKAGAVAARGLDDLDVVNRVGPIAARDVGGHVHLRTTAGPIAVALARSRPITAVDLSTIAGPVAMAVPRRFEASYDVVSEAGPVRVPDSVPGGVPVHVHVDAGPIAIGVRG